MYEELKTKFGYVDGQIGVTLDDEYVIVSIDNECATVQTLQENGWMRVNVYYPDGTEEEYYRK